MNKKCFVEDSISKDITKKALSVTHSFRKKPVVIQAVQMFEEFWVDTLEGTMRGNPYDG